MPRLRLDALSTALSTAKPADAILAEFRGTEPLVRADRHCWRFDKQTVVAEFELAGHAAALDVRVGPDRVSLSVVARGDKLARYLRSALIGKARLAHDPTERHLLHEWPAADLSPREIAEAAAEWVTRLTAEVDRAPSELRPDLPLPDDHVSVWWWDAHSNFGDALGPWMVHRLTGRDVVNGKRIDDDVPTLVTVGSIIGHLNRGSVDIWGAGLMRPLKGKALATLRSLEDVRVHAVRGAQTRAELVDKLGWDVPEVYGDPGLLLPRFYRPAPSAASRGKISVVAHAKHAEHFAGASSSEVHQVDVGHSLEQVVDEIASSAACISTSLHGVIVAQAYGVPWTWLKISDAGLRGGKYKFEDFFTVLDRSRVSKLDVGVADVAGLDLAAVIGQATLPELTRSPDDLLDAFPLPRAAVSP